MAGKGKMMKTLKRKSGTIIGILLLVGATLLFVVRWSGVVAVQTLPPLFENEKITKGVKLCSTDGFIVSKITTETGKTYVTQMLKHPAVELSGLAYFPTQYGVTEYAYQRGSYTVLRFVPFSNNRPYESGVENDYRIRINPGQDPICTDQ